MPAVWSCSTRRVSGNYNGVISDARQMLATSGPLLSGSLVKDDLTGASGGNVTLAAAQAYSGGTFIESGTLTLGVANAIASSSGVDLGRVGGSTATQIAQVGTARPNAATLALGANNTIQGLMDEAGNITAVQLNTNTLTLNVGSGQVFNFGGAITGTGNLVMSGSGAEFLNGTSTYTGTTTVNGGLLSVNGSIATSSLTTVNAGGALGGTGFVGNTIDQWRHAGARQQFHRCDRHADRQRQSRLYDGGDISGPGDAGRLDSRGKVFRAAAAALAGTVQVVSPTNSYAFNQPYTILTSAGGLGGTQFNSLSLPNFIVGALSYTPNNVSLSLSLAFEQAAGLNANQKTVASAIDRVVNASGSLPPAFGALLNLPASSLPGVLSQLSGEIGTGAQQTTFSAMTQFMNTLLDHFVGGGAAPVSPAGASQYADDAASAYASKDTSLSNSQRDAYAAVYNKAAPRPVDPFAQRWSVWVAGFGGSQTTDGNAAVGSNGSTSSIAGTAVGADYRISPNTVAGFALAGGGTSFNVAGLR